MSIAWHFACIYFFINLLSFFVTECCQNNKCSSLTLTSQFGKPKKYRFVWRLNMFVLLYVFGLCCLYIFVLFYVLNCVVLCVCVVLYIKCCCPMYCLCRLCCSVYCLCRLCCSMYCLCVNVYCTTATSCQPNCSKQIYYIAVSSLSKWWLSLRQVFSGKDTITYRIISLPPAKETWQT